MNNTVGVVLAAGFGTRLRPCTDYKPKPLIPVAGIEPLFFALDSLRRAGIKRAVVNAHHLPQQISQACDDWAALLPGLEVRCIVESPEILGSGGGLINIVRSNPDWFDDAGMLVLNGDTVASLDITRILPRAGADGLFAVSYLEQHLKRYNPLWVNARNAWTGIGKTAPNAGDRPAHLLGVHSLSEEVVARMLGSEFESAPSDLFNAIYRPLTDAGSRIEAITYFDDPSRGEFWFDMTTQAFLLEAQHHVFQAPAWSQWRELLTRRYPNVKEIAPGVMVAGTLPRDFQMRCEGPLVFINGSNLAPDARAFDFRRLGPETSVVIESLAEDKVFLLPETSRNSVLVVGATPGQTIEDPKSIDNSVLVV